MHCITGHKYILTFLNQTNRLNINDERWQKAMQAIADSILVIGSKTYVRFYNLVGDSYHYQPLSLDIAGI